MNGARLSKFVLTLESRKIMESPKKDGGGRQRCSKCEARSIKGLINGYGLCPYHWTEAMWGKKWADKCYSLPDLTPEK